MADKYTHLELDQEVRSIAGYYIPLKEVRLQFAGREVLYMVGQAALESSCCGSSHWIYAVVPGYILNWQNGSSESGRPTSDTEPITDITVRKQIADIIRKNEQATQIEFW